MQQQENPWKSAASRLVLCFVRYDNQIKMKTPVIAECRGQSLTIEGAHEMSNACAKS
jgi:hypothetical protein